MKINVFNCSVKGASHERSGLPCQDSSCSFTGNNYYIIAVADGHGDPKHDLSEIGAKIAVESATYILRQLTDNITKQRDISLSKMVKYDFPRLLLRRWRNLVENDFRQRIISGEKEFIYEEGSNLFSRYGTTLLAAIITETDIIYTQIGDGDIVLLRNDNTYEIFSFINQSLVGGETHSLSSNEAVRYFSCGTTNMAGIRGLFLSTDGLRNSYDNESAFIRLLSAIAEMVDKDGIEVTKEVISKQFAEFSKNGSGDDIAIAAIIATPAQSEGATLHKQDENAEKHGTA